MGDELVRIVEAIYAVERPERAWLEGVVEAARPALEEGLGAFAYLYDTRGRAFSVRNAAIGGPCPLTPQMVSAGLSKVSHEYVEKSWAAMSCGTASEIEGWEEERARGSRDAFHAVGVADLLCVNGFDPSGIGCCLAVPLRGETRLAERQRTRLARVARHLAAAFRVRQRIGANSSLASADAVFTPGGRLEHAANDASVRDDLRDAVVAIDRLRTKKHREEGESAVSQWRVRVRARWTLVDAFESDGRRYVVAVANEPELRGAAALSEREKQILTYAALGHSNKLIAYELGLSAATVRVHFSRAAAKLGARRREEAIALYRASRSK